MRPRMSSLNPHATSYVPLSKREAEIVTSVTEKGSENLDGRTLLDSRTSGSEKMPGASQMKSNPASDSYSTSSQNVTKLTDNQFLDEDSDMDIEFLRISFPGISEQSLRDVYMVNGDDVDAAIDMLTQLELDDVDTCGSLPETLDIGDVSESVSSADSASLKLKNVAAEASTSSKPLPPSNYHK